MSGAKLQDVALKAGVSLATASLALSGKGRISTGVRERVHGAALQLGYSARRDIASGAATAAARFGILHADDRAYEWNFVRPAIVELERFLHQKGMAPVLLPFAARTSAEHVLQIVIASGVTAVFAIQYANGRVLEELVRRGVRVVVINNSQFQDQLPTVCVDDFQGAYEGTRSLLAFGHRSFGFVEYERPESPAVVADRFVGFRKALDEHHIAFSAEQRITISFMDARRLASRLRTVFSRQMKPTAIFAHDDFLGLYVIAALREMGLEVPRDVSLVAPGDVLDYSLPLMPQITTMRIDMTLLGRTAANLMIDTMRTGNSEVHVLKVKEQIVHRASCRKV